MCWLPIAALRLDPIVLDVWVSLVILIIIRVIFTW